MDTTERQTLDDRLALVGVLQELTVTALDLFDPARSLDDLLQKVATRLGCRAALCIEGPADTQGRLSLLGAAGLARSSLALELPELPVPLNPELVDLPYPELASANLTRWVVRPRVNGQPQAVGRWWLALYFEREPRLPHQYRSMMERLAHYLGVALVHRRLYQRTIDNERNLRITSSRLESLINNLQSGVLTEDANRCIADVNQAFCDMFGVKAPPAALRGADCVQAAQASKGLFTNPDRFLARIDEILKSGEAIIGEELRLADGRVFERDYVPVRLEDATIGNLWSYRDVTRAYQAAQEIRRLNEDLERRVAERTQELASANQELEASLKTLRDTQAQLIQTGKLAAVGQLAAGVAHEINNPLAVILGFAQGMERRVPAGDPLQLPVSSIVRESLRCKALVQELLAFSRTAKKTLEDVDPNALLRGCGQLLESRARTQDTRIVFDLADVPVVRANGTQLQQVIVNLGNNALDALGQGGEVVLRTRRSDTGDTGVVLEVQDTGPGIPKEICARIFEPFFTTKEVGKGTGLGLSLAYTIIEQHGGRVEVVSEIGKGTSMIVRLPLAPPPPPPPRHRNVISERRDEP